KDLARAAAAVERQRAVRPDRRSTEAGRRRNARTGLPAWHPNLVRRRPNDVGIRSQTRAAPAVEKTAGAFCATRPNASWLVGAVGVGRARGAGVRADRVSVDGGAANGGVVAVHH